ncbi:MAG: GntR family transcriptional regulator [Planctomycetes bacterium]|nr:GntR family transcriptional regulator [Planctomycetota bacterium]
MVKQVQLARHQPLYRQLLAHYEDAIASGALAAGDRLPATIELAQRFQVAAATVQEALGQLQKRGLVERVPGRGTVVSARAAARTWGVIYGEPVLIHPDRRVYTLVTAHMQRLLEARGIVLRLYHPQLDGGLAGTWQDVRRDAGDGLLRVLLPLCPGGDLGRRLAEDCPLPASTGAPWITEDRSFGRLGAAHLLAAGRRRIALVSCGAQQRAALCAGVAEAHAQAGLAWPDGDAVGDANTEAGGHTLAQAILAGPGPRPDAWLVADDNACRGVVTALLWQGQRIPADAALVSHGNRGLEPVLPIRLTRLEYDPAEMAAATIAAADAVIAGQAPTQAVLTARLVAGDSVPAAGARP